MNFLQPTEQLLKTARRVVWFQKPQETLDNPTHFLSYAMTFGTVDDLVTLQQAGVTLNDYKEVLNHAPAGVFDARSWTYWNLRCGNKEVPPLPVRNLH
jgi:hypothetical protein